MKVKLFKLILPLVLGGIIYGFLRKSEIVFFNMLNLNLPLSQFSGIPDWLVYNLPDGLWSYSFTNLVLLIWNHQINRKNFGWIIIPVITGIILELSQLTGLIKGTFDIFDIVYIILFSFIPIIGITKIQLKWKNLKITGNNM